MGEEHLKDANHSPEADEIKLGFRRTSKLIHLCQATIMAHVASLANRTDVPRSHAYCEGGISSIKPDHGGHGCTIHTDSKSNNTCNTCNSFATIMWLIMWLSKTTTRARPTCACMHFHFQKRKVLLNHTGSSKTGPQLLLFYEGSISDTAFHNKTRPRWTSN